MGMVLNFIGMLNGPITNLRQVANLPHIEKFQ